MESLKPLLPRIDAFELALRDGFSRWTASSPPALAEAMRYSLFAPGKRLRPLLVILACEAVGGAPEKAYPAAAAVEMIHTYSLIHDDLPAMDDDDLRRGIPTCHKKYGEALAILAGDGLLTLAFEALARGYNARTASVTTLELAIGAGASGMVAGQVLDLTADGRIDSVGNSSTASGSEVEGHWLHSEAGLEAIHRAKTGALFRAALRMGVYAAEVDAAIETKALEAINRYARAFGLLFQVTDDLLDVSGTAETTGKRVGKDAARGKSTYPGLIGIDASRRKASELAQEAVAAAESLGPLGKPLADLARYVVTRDR